MSHLLFNHSWATMSDPFHKNNCILPYVYRNQTYRNSNPISSIWESVINRSCMFRNLNSSLNQICNWQTVQTHHSTSYCVTWKSSEFLEPIRLHWKYFWNHMYIHQQTNCMQALSLNISFARPWLQSSHNHVPWCLRRGIYLLDSRNNHTARHKPPHILLHRRCLIQHYFSTATNTLDKTEMPYYVGLRLSSM